MSVIIKESHTFPDASLPIVCIIRAWTPDTNTLSLVRHIISNYKRLLKGSITTWEKLEWLRLDSAKRCNTNQFCKSIQSEELMNL